MSQRLSPKEIKQDIRHDDLRTWLEKVTDWLVANWEQTKIAALALVVLGVVVAAVLTWLDHRQASADEQLAAAIATFEAPLTGDAAAETAPKTDAPRYATDAERRAAAKALFEEVPGIGAGASGRVAELFLADIAVQDGDGDRAAEIWRRFLASHDGDALAASVQLNLFRLRREKGEGQQVADELRRELERPGGNLPDDVVLFELAETLDRLGQADEAGDLYQRLVDEHPQSTYSSKARERAPAARAASPA